MNNENTNVMTYNNDGVAALAGFGDKESLLKAAPTNMLTSLSMEDKAGIMRAMSNADYNFLNWCNDNPGEPVYMKDILFHSVTLTDDETGELSESVRTVIIDVDGVTYAAVSQGVVGSLQKIMGLYGMPPYADGLPIIAKQVQTRKWKTIQVLPYEAIKAGQAAKTKKKADK